jgi:hypothetical protein
MQANRLAILSFNTQGNGRLQDKSMKETGIVCKEEAAKYQF